MHNSSACTVSILRKQFSIQFQPRRYKIHFMEGRGGWSGSEKSAFIVRQTQWFIKNRTHRLVEVGDFFVWSPGIGSTSLYQNEVQLYKHVWPVWVQGHCRINPPHFLAECRKRRLNQGSFVLLYFRLSTLFDLYFVSVCLFSSTALFVSISQVTGCEDRLRNDYIVSGGELNSTHSFTHFLFCCWHNNLKSTALNSLELTASNNSQIPQERQISNTSVVCFHNQSACNLFDWDKDLELLTCCWRSLCPGTVNKFHIMLKCICFQRNVFCSSTYK